MSVDYYDALGLERKLALDTAVLQRSFYERSRQWHPDRFATRPVEEQQRALDETALINDAYRVLRDPVQRAEYLLKLEGFDIGEQRTKDVPPELLEEVFELNMMLEGVPDEDELEAARKRFADLLSDVDREMVELFDTYDASPDRSTLQALRGLLNRRRYIQNLVRDVNLPNRLR